MIGIINRLLVDFVETRGGKQAVADVLVAADLPANHTFRSHTHYENKDWETVYAAAVAASGETRDDFEWAFGTFAGERLYTYYPHLVKECKSARELIAYQPKIHNTLAELIGTPEQRQAVNYKFRLETHDDDLVMHYHSPNRMCTFYRSLATWAAAHFNETVAITEAKCMKRGDAECEMHLQFASQ
jgi:hypothetical protein